MVRLTSPRTVTPFWAEIPVPVCSGRNQAHGRQVPGLRVEGDVPALDMDGAAAALGHLEAVAQQGEAVTSVQLWTRYFTIMSRAVRFRVAICR